LVTLEWIEGRPSVAFRAAPDQVARLLTRKNFFETPYGRGQWVSLWVDKPVGLDVLKLLVERSYRIVALKRMLATLNDCDRP
jgi:predicted DNA-binding protein (MmcQ/YjbR family)